MIPPFDLFLSALVRTVFLLLELFGGVFALATALWFASQRLRGDGYGRFGRGYVLFVAPGVVCHETGHALGCLLTGRRIVEFVPFRPSGNELGHVTHEGSGTFFGRTAEFVIGTGPVWFGTLVILLLARLLGGRELLSDLDFLAPLPGESVGVRCVCVAKGALWMLRTLLSPERWGSVLFPVCFYLIFCIASEITLSPPDLGAAWRGFVSLAAVLFLLNLVPAVSGWLLQAADSLRPALFLVHVLLLFALVFDGLLLAAAGLFRRLSAKGGGRRR